MLRHLRFSLTNVLLAITCIALAIGWWSTVKLPQPLLAWDRSPTNAAIQMWPLTISMSDVGSAIGGWNFSVNAAGDGVVTLLYAPNKPQQSVKVTQGELQKLKDMLVQEQFFSLDDDYGEIVPDGGTQTLTITSGESTKTVRIHYLGNWTSNRNVGKLREPARALRVGMLIRGWFSNPDATDSRAHDRAVLGTVDAESKSGN